MRSTEPRLDRLSAVITVLAFGSLALLAPAFPTRVPASVAPPAPAAELVAPPVVPAVLTEVAGASATDPIVALTFDDGPDPRWTPLILDVLARHHAVATFCMVGDQVAAHADLVRDVVAAGMRLCDHSRTHGEGLSTSSDAEMSGEIIGAQQDLVAAAAAPVGYFRAPGGVWSSRMVQMATGAAMQSLGWSVDPRDWQRPGVEAIVTAVQKQAHPGAIVLLHDGGGRREQTVAALEQLLPWFTAHGYRFGFPTH